LRNSSVAAFLTNITVEAKMVAAKTDMMFDKDSLDRLLFDIFRGDIPNMEAARKILRHWMLGDEIFRLLMERGRLADAREDHATWMFRDGGRMTLYPEGTWEMEDGVLRHGWLALTQVLSPAWRVR
jgi:hypothetical protein